MAAAEPRTEPMLDHALVYLHAGLPVFPCCSPLMGIHQHRDPDTREMVTCPKDRVGKVPMVRWRGYQNELPDEETVRQWWSRWPTANIALCTGELSGILVLDADGTDARKTCLQNGGLDETPMVWTGKVGGAHFHLAYPGGDVRNFARKLPGTDMRAQGGYVLMPPSMHSSGNIYRWNESTRHFSYAAVPGWLQALIEADGPDGDGHAFGDDFDIHEVLEGIPEGKRDDTLYRYACRLRHDDVPKVEAEELLRRAARACIPPFVEAAAVGKVRRAYEEFAPPGSPTAIFDEEIVPPGREGGATEPDMAAVFSRPISELLAMPDEDPDWMVEKLFTVASNGWIGAEPKVGKSWLALELAYAVSTGVPFLGRFSVKQARRVLYVQEEDPATRVKRRLRQIIDGDQSRSAPPDEYFRYVIRQGFKLDSAAWIEILRREIISYDPEVIVLDVFNRLHGSDENKQQEMTAILNILTGLTNQYGCAFIVVHHNRKPQAGGEARGSQSLRGSGVLGSWGECSLYLRPGKEKNQMIVTPESKDAPELDDFTVTIEDQENGGVLLQMGEVEQETRMARGDIDVLDAVTRLVTRGIGATVRAVADDLGKDRSTIQARLKRLTKDGYLNAMPISDEPFSTILYTVVSR